MNIERMVIILFVIAILPRRHVKRRESRCVAAAQVKLFNRGRPAAEIVMRIP
jgi:hypothetical protein